MLISTKMSFVCFLPHWKLHVRLYTNEEINSVSELNSITIYCCNSVHLWEIFLIMVPSVLTFLSLSKRISLVQSDPQATFSKAAQKCSNHLNSRPHQPVSTLLSKGLFFPLDSCGFYHILLGELPKYTRNQMHYGILQTGTLKSSTPCI